MTEEQKKVLIDLMICCRSWEPQVCVMGNVRAGDAAHAIRTALLKCEEETTFQARVQPWLMECFGAMIAGDREERNHRFFEEAAELVQACGMTASEAHQLVDYVYGRPVGEPHQEVGGVMVTLAALCLANALDMHEAAETELARIWTKVEQIRAKQAAKPKHSPLPQAIVATSASSVADAAAASEGQAVEKIADELSTSHGHHVEDERNPDPVGHWWTFDREALSEFANRVATPSASIADTAGAISNAKFALEKLDKAHAILGDNWCGALDDAHSYLEIAISKLSDTAGAKPSNEQIHDIAANYCIGGQYRDIIAFARAVIAAPPAPSVADAAGALYTMDQMRDYALAFHKARIDAALTEERYVEAASSIDRVAELCKFTDYDPDVGRVPERFTPKYMDFVRAMLVKG